MKSFLIVAFLALLLPSSLMAQKFGVKTNLLYDATATINLGVEAALAPKMTIDVSGNFNNWEFGDKQWKHILVQPELRYWFCEKFNGHFIGLHGHYAKYNIGGFGFLPVVGHVDDTGFIGGTSIKDDLKHNRYQGHLWGAGISWGYQWIIGKRWNLEATIGGGYARLDDTKYPIADCGEAIRSRKYNYWGVTKAGLSFIYMIW